MREIARKILDLGTDASTPLDMVIAIRSANLCAVCLTFVSVGSATAYTLGAKVPSRSVPRSRKPMR